MVVDQEILETLDPQILLSAYAQGAFPMVQDGELMWFSPDPRGLLPLDGRFHVPRRLKRTIRSGRYVCTVNQAFGEVVRLCGQRGEDSATWISPEIRIAYGRLHKLGLAHSVEAWRAEAVGDGAPVGGLYGVSLGGAFFGESMFHTATDAGKVALVYTVGRLRACGYQLFDIQWTTENLRRYGAIDVPRADYLGLLSEALATPCRFA